MVVPFGFSVGDCIAVCLLIKDAVQALDSAHGASADYQQVIRELWALDRALLEVINVSQGFETTIELNALSHAARRTADQCRACIEGFLEKVKGYRRMLGSDEGCGTRWRDVRGKVGWAILRGDDLKVFRTEINAHASAINMLMLTASVSLAKLNDKNLRERMEDARRTQEEKADDQLVAIRQVKDTIQGQTNVLQAHGDTVARLADGMKYFFALGTELKTFMARIWTLNFRSYNILVDLQTRVPREFGPCWIQEPLTLTDALGRTTPVHLELINSWDVLDSVLIARFRNRPGERKVKSREYALQDCGSMMDIDRNVSFEASFLPGRKVDMSMIFKPGIQLGLCPGCRTRTERDTLVAITCVGCGLCFQRIEEVVEHMEFAPPVKPNTFTSHADFFETDGGSTRPVETPSFKRTIETDTGDSMRMFKRVRLLYTKHNFNIKGPSPSRFRRREMVNDYTNPSWRVHISLLPFASQPFPFMKDTTAYRRCLSRGLHQVIDIQNTDSQSFQIAVDKAFSHVLFGRIWEPLKAKMVDTSYLRGYPMLRRLDAPLRAGSTWSRDFLAKNCAVCDESGRILDMYIAMSNDAISWEELKMTRPSKSGLEDLWTYDPLLDVTEEEFDRPYKIQAYDFDTGGATTGKKLKKD